MRLWKFIIVLLIIFALERLLPFLIPARLAIFPVFAVFYLISSHEFNRDFWRIILVSFFFDPFSGLVFGFFALSVAVVGLSIYFAKKYFKIVNPSFFSSLIIILFFLTEYFMISLINFRDYRMLLKLPLTLAENAIIFLVLALIFKKNIHGHLRQI